LTCTRAERSLSIGDITFRIVSDDPRLVSLPEGPLEHFRVETRVDRPADVEVRARWRDAPDETADAPGSDGELVFDSAGSWRLVRTGGEFLFTFRSAAAGPAPYKTARFDPTFASGEIELSRRHFVRQPEDAVYPLAYPLDELLMIHLLAQGRGVEIHSCALLDAAGRAHLFAGQSGAGKSTMARLWLGQAGVRLISDERVVLRTDRQRIIVYGTPWHGDAMLASPQCGELASVFFLNHAGRASTPALKPVGGPLAAARLLACSFLPFHSPTAIDRTIGALERVAGEVRCHDLWFAPDRSVVDLLTRQMA
jgi:hypothetical protein